MKLKAILLGVALILGGVTQAQVGKESFEKAVDLLNCKTVELSLQSDKSFQSFQTTCPCGKTNYTQINQFLTSTGKLDKTIALSKEVESLKKSFNESWKKEDVVSFLSESIFTDKKYQKIVDFADKRKDKPEYKPEFETYKASLKTDLANMLVEDVQQANAPTDAGISQPTIEDRIAKLEKAIADNDNSWFSGITSQIIVVSIIVSLLLSFLTLFLAPRLFNNNESEVPNNIKSYVKRKIDDARFSQNISGGNINSSELRDANNRIRYLEDDIKKLNDRIDIIKSGSGITTPTMQSTFQETRQPEAITQTFFLSTPNSDGSFNESSASSTYREGATIYRFTKIESNRAKFQIDEKDASTKLALQYPDKNIDPVCDALNAFNPKATRITTVEQGEAELLNGKWIVEKNKKARIKYEN